MTLDDLPQGLRVCNCAGCRVLLSGVGERQKYMLRVRVLLPPEVAGRDGGRPYCGKCLAERNECKIPDRREPAKRPCKIEESENPWQSNAIRELEGE